MAARRLPRRARVPAGRAPERGGAAALSLQLLRYELPQFFRNLNIAHPAFAWPSALNRAGEQASNYSSLTHPFLRSHLLTDDYKLYDIERARLVNRATKFGLVSG